MTIALPDNKFHAYTIAISEMLKQGCTSKGELETNIGRWVHLGQIIPTVHHFLSSVIGHGIGGKDVPIMAHLAKARCWSKR